MKSSWIFIVLVLSVCATVARSQADVGRAMSDAELAEKASEISAMRHSQVDEMVEAYTTETNERIQSLRDQVALIQLKIDSAMAEQRVIRAAAYNKEREEQRVIHAAADNKEREEQRAKKTAAKKAATMITAEAADAAARPRN